METARLLALITEADEEIRGAAIDELTVRMNDEVARAFLDVAASDAAEDVRADAVVALGPIIDQAGMDYDDEDDTFDLDPDFGPPVTRKTFETIVREVRDLYDDESQPKVVRRRAFEVLIRDPRPWQAAEVRRRFASDDPEWRLTAVFAMGYVDGFEDEIAAVLETGQEELLTEAVQAAGRMSVTAAADRIRELATSKRPGGDLQLLAIEALPHVDRDSFEVLDRLLRSNDEDVAAMAEAALQELALAQSLDEVDFDEDDDDFDDEDDFFADDDEDEDDDEGDRR